MKIVKKVEFVASGSAHGAKHDWDAILGQVVPADKLGKDGQPAVEIVAGEDFTGKTENFANTIKIKAQEAHLKAFVNIVRGTEAKDGKPATPDTILVHVCKMTDEEAAEADVKIEARKERDKASLARRKAKGGTTESTSETEAAA